MKLFKAHHGAIALTSVIILGAVISIIALTIALAGVSSRANTFHILESEQLYLKAEGCLEEALIQLKRDNGYTGETLNVDGASCVISISGAPERDIQIEASEGDFVHDFDVNVQLDPFLILDFNN